MTKVLTIQIDVTHLDKGDIDDLLYEIESICEDNAPVLRSSVKEVSEDEEDEVILQ